MNKFFNFIGRFNPFKSNAGTRDYKWAWVNPDGMAYRTSFYERQRQGGSKPLLDNPTASEVSTVLDKFEAKTVLEVGCGFGRLLEQLPPRFITAGCDISTDMLSKAPEHLHTFHLDIAYPSESFINSRAGSWDCIFTRGVMLYLTSNQEACANALKNMKILAKRKVIFWEWPEVCDKLRALTSNDDFFDYQPITHKDE